MTGLPLRPCSWATSSSCRSSTNPRSWISASNGIEEMSAITRSRRRCRLFCAQPHLRALEVLQFDQDRRRILCLGNDFLLRDQALLVFVDQETVERDHSIFGPGLDVRIDAKGFVVANQRGDG